MADYWEYDNNVLAYHVRIHFDIPRDRRSRQNDKIPISFSRAIELFEKMAKLGKLYLSDLDHLVKTAKFKKMSFPESNRLDEIAKFKTLSIFGGRTCC